MIIIAGTMTLDPAKVDDFMEVAVKMMHETHKEPGNLAYAFRAVRLKMAPSIYMRSGHPRKHWMNTWHRRIWANSKAAWVMWG